MAAMKREELLDLIPAYAIGALDADERAELEASLRHDPELQALLADYQAVAGHLVALVPPREAPSHLQADLRQRLAASRGSTAAGTVHRPAAVQPPARRRLMWILSAAAVLVIVLAAVLVARFGVGDDSDPASEAAQVYYELLEHPDARQYQVVAGEVVDTVGGDLVVSPDGKRAVLCVKHLPPITDEQTFQMWLVDSAGVRSSAGMFQNDPPQEKLYFEVPFDGPVTTYQAVGVSLEPAGGSPHADRPTGPRVLSVPLAPP